MEHPLIGSLNDLSSEQLSAQILSLSQKLTIAARSGNGHLCNQLRMALTSYQNKYQEKMHATYSKQLADAKIDTSKIDIQ